MAQDINRVDISTEMKSDDYLLASIGGKLRRVKVSDATGVTEEINEKVENIIGSDEFNTTIDYATGDYVIYENVLYKFKMDKPAGEWDASAVEAVDIKTELDKLENALKPESMIDIIYPVGSIYMNINDISPATFIGGTWERLANRFLVGAGDTHDGGSTGGNASVTSGDSSKNETGSTTLTVDQIPSHSHTYNDYSVSTNTYGAQGTGFKQMYTNETYKFTTDATGGGKGHTHSMGHTHEVNTMPPYLAVYMWKRTA